MTRKGLGISTGPAAVVGGVDTYSGLSPETRSASAHQQDWALPGLREANIHGGGEILLPGWGAGKVDGGEGTLIRRWC